MLRSTASAARLCARAAAAPRPSTSSRHLIASTSSIPSRTLFTTPPTLAKPKARKSDDDDIIFGGTAISSKSALAGSGKKRSSSRRTRLLARSQRPIGSGTPPFDQLASTLAEALKPESIAQNGPPGAGLWRTLLKQLRSKQELIQAADFARQFAQLNDPLRDRDSQLLVSRAVKLGHPEIALDIIANRHTTHMEPSLASLRAIQRKLAWRLCQPDPSVLIEGANEPGKPVSTEAELAAALAGIHDAPEPTDSKNKPASKISSLELISAKLSLLDRMCVVAALSQVTTVTTPLKGSQDPLVVSLLLSTLVSTFRLGHPIPTAPRSISPAEEKLYARADSYLLHLLRASKVLLGILKSKSIDVASARVGLKPLRVPSPSKVVFSRSLDQARQYAAWRRRRGPVPEPLPSSSNEEEGEAKAKAKAAPSNKARKAAFPPQDTHIILHELRLAMDL